MSEIKVNSIKGVGASTAAITVNNTDGTCTANLTNKPNRNLIINGAMQVAQRGTSSGSSGYKTVDRFQFSGAGLNAAITTAQVDVASNVTPYTLGFRKAYKLTNGAQTGPDAGDTMVFLYRAEAQDIANSGWNYTSSSSYITLSYWIKSSVAQNFFVTLKSGDGTPQKYATETGSLSADTWTKVTKTISGNSNLTFNNDNGEGLEIEWSIFRGTNQTGSMSLNAWAANNNSVRTPDQTSTFYTTNGATFEITGVQLEVGSVATDFEHRSYSDEFQKCLRYYEQMSSNGVSVAYFATGYCESTTEVNYPILFKAYKRATPTVSSTAGSTFRNHHTGTSVDCSNIVFNLATPMSCRAQTVASSAVLTDGNAAILAAHSSTEALIKIDAEL
jgi:hypothetical protein